MPDYTPSAAAASGPAYAGRTVTDLIAYPSYLSTRWDAQFGAYEHMNEIMALWLASTAPSTYSQTYVCLAGLNVGDPVKGGSPNSVFLATADTAVKARVIGFVSYKPTATTCRLAHFYYVSGLTAGTVASPIYLTDAGGFSATPGTINKVLGILTSTTSGIVSAFPSTAMPDSITSDNLDASALLATRTFGG